MRLHRLRVSIRTQLIALVCVVALTSLVILAVITGVYFTSNFTNSRIERLQIIAQLKASQMEQSFYYLYYQAYYLSTRESLQTALLNHKVGNSSSSVLSDAMSTLQQFLDSSDTFVSGGLYDLNLNVVGNATNGLLSVNETIAQELSPFRPDEPFPQSIISDGGYIQGPLRNDTSYLMSLSLPIFSNQSVLISVPDLSGYLSMILKVDSFESVSNDNTTALEGAQVTTIQPREVSNGTNSTVTGFKYVFSPKRSEPDMTLVSHSIKSYKPAALMYLADKITGSVEKTVNPFGKHVAVGFCQIDLMFDTWGAIVEQGRSEFLQPVHKLIKIIVGTVIGIAVFMCLVTLPLAHFGVRPIIRLQKATEAITQGRGLKKSKKKNKAMSPDLLSPNSENHNMDSSGFERYRNSSTTTTRFSNVSGMMTPSSDTSFPPGSSPSYPHHFNTPIVVPKGDRFIVDELSELTDAFNVMTEELDRQYSHLEERVRERTKELEVAKIQAESAKMQAEAANEAKTVFIANISHELRTPLNGILGMTAIAMTETSVGKVKESLELIFRSGELLLHILTQLLTFSKNQLDKSKLENRNFQMIEVVSQVQSIFGKTAKDQKVILTLTMKPNLLRKMVLFGDSNRIIQVVMNLVSNSLKFTPEHGHVSVTVKVVGEYDEQRSKRCNYERVFVKQEEPKLMMISEDSAVENGVENRNVFDTDSGDNTEESIKEKREESVPPDDTETIHTLSSSVYEKVVTEKSSPSALSSTDDSDVSEKLEERTDDTTDETERFSVMDEKDDLGDEEDEDLGIRSTRSKTFKQQKKWVIEITVTDTGTGINEALQEKVFEAFVQGDQTLSRSYGGTGLGLSICRQLAKMMHGTLTLQSKVGFGSTFTFRIPLPQTGEVIVAKEDEFEFCEDQFNPDRATKGTTKHVTIREPGDEDIHIMEGRSSEEGEVGFNEVKRKGSFEQRNVLQLSVPIPGKDEMQPPTTLISKPQLLARASTGTAHSDHSSNVKDREGGGLRILVAEDNMVNQEVIKRMLILEGFTDITLACDGSEAIDTLKSVISAGDHFDLIFMDVQMPNIDGLLATKLIRQELKYDGPIVALTAFADKSNEEGCLEAGMSGFLSKPIRRNQLRKIIMEMCPQISSNMMSGDETNYSSRLKSL